MTNYTGEPENRKRYNWSVTYTAHFQGAPENVNNIKYQFTVIQNALGLGKTKTINEIFEAGLAALLEKQDEDKIKPSTRYSRLV